MTSVALRESISQALAQFEQADLRSTAEYLFGLLGYKSSRRYDLPDTSAATFAQHYDQRGMLTDKAQMGQWRSIEMLFQVGRDELVASSQMSQSAPQFEPQIYHSFLFFTIDLLPNQNQSAYTRSELAAITRELNRLFPMPVSVLFRFPVDSEDKVQLSLAIVTHRPNKRDEQRDVLEKVSLIHAIRPKRPHRAHIEVLCDLALDALSSRFAVFNFEDLQRAWARTLDTSELNKRFYRELSDWYFWAIDQVTFPQGAQRDPKQRNPMSMIRLLTRVMFVWFLREKHLVPDELFTRKDLEQLLVDFSPESSSYYKAILQNLFFATLNTEMDNPKLPRRFRSKHSSGGRDGHFGISSVYRYEDYFRDAQQALDLFKHIPFLNGGLFECLDPIDNRTVDTLVDGFSEMKGNPLHVPNRLFFDGPDGIVDLNSVYGTRGRRYQVRGLIDIFESYKFTIAENTPIEEEVALDPELLGHVFENLLAAYNPETRLTARKETGSFYTPRNVVEYMVDESLLLLFRQKLTGQSLPSFTLENEAQDGDEAVVAREATLDERLRLLLGYNDYAAEALFTKQQIQQLVTAIDDLKIIDPAVGSGAFPMGVLQKLVHVLGKLDPHNRLWKERQLADAERIPDVEAREAAKQGIEEAFERNELGYGRKLYLIEKCIYGVDIQPIAVLIAKLRFFISLLVDQRVDDALHNRGVRALPNLETRLVAANSLAKLHKQQLTLPNPDIIDLEQQLADVRSRHFSARTIAAKRRYRDRDQELRAQLQSLLQDEGYAPEQAELMAQWDPYNQNTSANFFDPKWMFGLDRGFDLVIANPPYVRQEQLKERKQWLQSQYPHVYNGTADLLVYFYALALDLLRDNGVLCFITSNKYLRAGYGKQLRSVLARETEIAQLIDFGDASVFTAIAYPSIIVAEKHVPAEDHQLLALNWNPNTPLSQFTQEIERARAQIARPGPNAPLVLQKRLTPDGWRLEGEATQRLLDKLRRAGRPLGDYVGGRFYRGVLTGLNEAFVVDRATRDRLIAEHPSSAELLKPFLRGRDVKRWRVDFAEQYLIKIESSENKLHSWSNKPAPEAERIFQRNYPAIHAWFEPLRDALVNRYDQGKYFWELRACAYWQEFEQPKIIYPDIYEHQSFSYDAKSFFAGNTCYFIPTQELWLLGLLNSKTIEWFYSLISNRIRGGYLRAFSDYMTQLPIPISSSTTAIDGLVERILATKQQDAKADVSAWEDEINQRVYALYGLRSDEIRLIEETVGGASAIDEQPGDEQ